MSRYYPRFATSSALAGLLILLISLGGGWGEVYGQTAGPTPTAGPRASLSVTKQVDNANPRRGDIVAFTIRVQNTGSVAARNVIIRDVVPGAFDILNASATAGTVEVRGQTVAVTVPAIDPGVTVLVVIEARVRNDAQGELRNTVIVREADDPATADGVNEQRATVTLTVAEGAADAPPAGGQASGQTGQSGASDSLLSGTGAGSGLQLPLLLIGIALVLAGGLVFLRTRTST
jgi:uncharacterized repeat protein (TIGR01451 family)